MNTTRKPMMTANWKMNKTTQEAQEFFTDFRSHLMSYRRDELPEVVICPSYTNIPILHSCLSTHAAPMYLGAQNLSQFNDGAYTGEISTRMLKDLLVSHVIIGHSERRQYFAETDTTVKEKVKRALAEKLTPIICVGESLEQREAGETDTLVEAQVKAALAGLQKEQVEYVVFAYEPIWAIGTGKVCEADEANRVCGLIRQWAGNTQTRVLYGGSMNANNVESLLQHPDIDGGLVGGASLEADTFIKLVQAAMPVKV